MGDLTPSAWTFHGHVLQTLDAKGRVTVPARWRHDGMDSMLALPDDVQPSLRLMPVGVLDRLLAKVEADEGQGEEMKAEIMRYYSFRAFECPLDKQGRLLVPSMYVERLGFNGTVQLVGAYRHFEMWKPEVWDDHFAKLQQAHAAGALRLNR
jgi:MraZ protein